MVESHIQESIRN